MVRVLSLGAVLALACTPAQRTASLATVSTATLAADWVQSEQYTAQCLEGNPVIGPCGQRVAPSVYFPLVIGASLLLGYALRGVGDGGWGDAWFASMAGVEGVTVFYNAMGL